MVFEFATAGRIIFGNGSLNKVGEIAPGLGRKNAGGQRERLCAVGNRCWRFWKRLVWNRRYFASAMSRISRPLNVGWHWPRKRAANFVIGFGGGSSLDSAKAISGLLTNTGELMDYLEVVGKGQKITNPAAPMIALPTTAGTGTEVTRNACDFLAGSPC